MTYPGMTIFLLFFGISLLDAVWTGDWPRALFWLGVGALFFVLDRMRRDRASTGGGART